MSLFSKDIIESSPIDANRIVSLIKEDRFGRYKGFWSFSEPPVSLDKITKEDIDEVLSNVLSYIYYFVLLGINNTNINVNQVSIPTGIFGVYSYNFNQYGWIIDYATEYLEELGFRVIYCRNDDKLTIDWIEKYCEKYKIQI